MLLFIPLRTYPWVRCTTTSCYFSCFSQVSIFLFGQYKIEFEGCYVKILLIGYLLLFQKVKQYFTEVLENTKTSLLVFSVHRWFFIDALLCDLYWTTRKCKSLRGFYLVHNMSYTCFFYKKINKIIGVYAFKLLPQVVNVKWLPSANIYGTCLVDKMKGTVGSSESQPIPAVVVSTN